MTDSEKRQSQPHNDGTFADQIERKKIRKVRARRSRARSIWFGLGMMGTVGWTVAVPTLLGAALGIWLDSRFPGSFSWTLTLLITGLLVGCLNAWMWVVREQENMEEDKREKEQVDE